MLTQTHQKPHLKFIKTSGHPVRRIHRSGRPATFIWLCAAAYFAAASVFAGESGESALPNDFPAIELKLHGATGPGKLFFASTFSNAGNYIIILNENGTPYFYRRFPKAYHGTEHFELQPNGLLTFFSFPDNAVYVLSPQFDPIDTFKCTPPYVMDTHEFVYLAENHALFVADETVPMDLSQVIDGGRTDALVRFNHVLELDENRNVLLDWDGRDHMDIRDAVHEDLRQRSINAMNINSIAVDYDGQLILSVRNFDEIIKMNRQTGAIIWRLGGNHSTFIFADESDRFCYQHDARPVPGKPDQYTLFDNGNFKNPSFSRAVEYALDTEKMTVEKVWEFRLTPDRYSHMMGSVQTLPNGNRFIDMSNFPPLCSFEVSPSGECLSELSATETSSYRVRKFEFNGIANFPYLIIEPSRTRIKLIFNQFGDTSVSSYRIYAGTSPEPSECVAVTDRTFHSVTDLENGQTVFFRVTSVDKSGMESGFSNTESTLINFYEPGLNMLTNGDFSDEQSSWTFTVSHGASLVRSMRDGIAECKIRKTGSEGAGDIRLHQSGLELVQGKSYNLSFDASSAERCPIHTLLESSQTLLTHARFENIVLTDSLENHAFEFTLEDENDFDARLVFLLGEKTGEIRIDNVFMTEKVNPESGLPVLNEAEDFRLYVNAPNPFNPVTVISYALAQKENIHLRVFNIRGESVADWGEQIQTEGIHAVSWDASDQASGCYIIHLQAGRNVKQKKCVLLK